MERTWTEAERAHIWTHCAGTADNVRAIVGALEDALMELRYSALDHSGPDAEDPQYLDAQTGALIDKAGAAHFALWDALDILRRNVEGYSVRTARHAAERASEVYNAQRFVSGGASPLDRARLRAMRREYEAELTADELRTADPAAYARIDADARS